MPPPARPRADILSADKKTAARLPSGNISRMRKIENAEVFFFFSPSSSSSSSSKEMPFCSMRRRRRHILSWHCLADTSPTFTRRRRRTRRRPLPTSYMALKTLTYFSPQPLVPLEPELGLAVGRLLPLFLPILIFSCGPPLKTTVGICIPESESESESAHS